MKISELIQLLQAKLEQYGDLPVYISHEWTESFEQTEYSGVRYHKEKISRILSDNFPERIDLS